MHFSSIDNPTTGAARVLAALRALRREWGRGEWISSWDLTRIAHVAAVGTRVSEVRHQGVPVEHQQVGGKHWYRLGRKEPPCAT